MRPAPRRWLGLPAASAGSPPARPQPRAPERTRSPRIRGEPGVVLKAGFGSCSWVSHSARRLRELHQPAAIGVNAVAQPADTVPEPGRFGPCGPQGDGALELMLGACQVAGAGLD